MRVYLERICCPETAGTCFFNEPVILNTEVAEENLCRPNRKLFNRRVKKKDGNAMEAEINARMLPTDATFAFIRLLSPNAKTDGPAH